MEMTLLHISVILLFTFDLCMQQCNADQVRKFQKPCNQFIDCGTNHVIAIANVVLDKNSRLERKSRIAAKNQCNGQRRCHFLNRNANCSIEYYCIDDRFVENCSVKNVSENMGNSSELFWCYNQTKQNQRKRRPDCWYFTQDVYHHWIVLRGIMKIKNESDGDGKGMTNFKLITSDNNSDVCTSSKYIWIIYVGTKNPNAIIDIYSKSDPTLTDSNQVTDINNDDLRQIKTKRSNMTENSQNDFSVNDDKNQNNNNNNNIDFLKIIIIISVAGGVLIILAITIAILWCCCRRCNNVTITNSESEAKKTSHDVKDVVAENPNGQIREGFIPTEAKRETCDSIGFWTDDEDYDPNDDRQSKIPPHIYAMGNCIYRRQSSKNDIYMNSIIPPPPTFEKEKDMYINMNSKPVNKHFNVYL